MKNWQRHIAILALYGAFTLLMTMPVVANISTHVAGQGGDPWQTMWRFEHEWENRDFLRTFGGGEPRLVNNTVWPWMGLHVVLGQPTAYNVVYLLSFVLSGYFMYLLVQYFTRVHLREITSGYTSGVLGEAPAFLAGVLYMFLPFHVAHSLGHFGAMQTQWLPMAILLLFMWVKAPTMWRTVGLAAVIALQSWSEHHYLLWFVIFAIIFFLFHLRGGLEETSSEVGTGSETANTPSLRQGFGRQAGESSKFHPRGGILVLFFALIFIFSFLPWWPMVRLAVQPSNNLSLGQEQTIRFSADLFSYITPPQWHPIWGGVAHELFGKHFTGNVVEATQFLGFLPLLLLLFFGQRIPRRQKTFWFIVAGIFFVISLGPRLHMFGKVLPLPLPYALFDSLPVLSAVRAVARAGIMVGFSVCVLFGWVMARELKRPISVAIVLAVILAEFLFLPVPLQEVQLSQAYAEIAQLPGTSLIEIPAATNYTTASQALYASRVHGKEGLGNIALERALDKEVFAEAKSLPGLRQLLFLRTAHILEDRKEFFDQDLRETLPDVLEWLDASAIAVRVDSLSAEQRRAVEYLLAEQLGWPGEKYDDVVLYKIGAPNHVGSGAPDGIFLARDGQWENVGYDPKRDSTFAEIPREAAITVYNVRAEPARVELEFTVESGSVRAGPVRDSAQQEPTGAQGHPVSNGVGIAGDHMSVSLTLAPGKQEITFESLLPGKAIIRNPKLKVL